MNTGVELFNEAIIIVRYADVENIITSDLFLGVGIDVRLHSTNYLQDKNQELSLSLFDSTKMSLPAFKPERNTKRMKNIFN